MIITGIGSRPKGLPLNARGEIEPWLVNLVKDVATVANMHGWTLRSGGADGMDDLFERFWGANKEIYLPTDNFRGHTPGSHGSIFIDDPMLINQAVSIVSKIHPVWPKLNKQAKQFHTRNAFQALGADLNSPSDMCIFYARIDHEGEVEGGTRTAVEICKQRGIDTYNLRSTDDVIKLQEFLEVWKAA